MTKVPGSWPAFFAPGIIPPAPGYRFPAGFVLCDRFRIVRFIAQGGMGSVYEAEDMELRERVALKMLRSEIVEDPKLLERFRRETQLARRVTHPNVCRIYDLFRHVVDPQRSSSDVVFLVMELLEGETLLARIREKGPYRSDEALPLVRQLVGALDAAHQAAVVHRDFKSANIILVPGKDLPGGVRAVVTDFGIARSLEPDTSGRSSDLTEVGEAIGTRDYAAPEQLFGGPVTPASDVYALGVVLYEILTGHRPYEADEPTTKRFERPPLPPSDLVPALPSRWNAAIMKCLSREPVRRYARAADVEKALVGSGRWRILPLAAGAALVLAAAALALVVVRSRPRGGAVSPFPHLLQVTSSARFDAWPSFTPDGGTLVYASERTGGFELYRLPLSAGGREAPLTSDGLQNLHPAVSPDGRHVAYTCRGRGGIWMVPIEGGTPRQLTRFGSRPAFAPDGTLLAFQSESPPSAGATDFGAMPPSTLWTLSLADGSLRRVTRTGDPPGGHGTPKFTPDGRWIVFCAFDPETARLWAVPVRGGPAVPLDAGSTYEFDPAIAPDGTLFFGSVTGEWRCAIRRVAVDWGAGRLAGHAAVVHESGAMIPRHLALSSDGTRLAYSAVGLRSNLTALRLDAGGGPAAPPRPLTSESARNSRPVFSPDGRRLAHTKWRPGVNIDVWLLSPDGTGVEQLTSDPAEDTAPSWFPRGDRVGFLTTRLGPATYFSQPVGGGAGRRELDVGPDFDSPRLSPDGTRVAFNSKRGGKTINVWVAELSGFPPRQVTFDREMAAFPCWSPDGKYLAVQVRRGDDRQVGIVPVAGGPIELLTDARGQSWSDTFSPDGGRVAFAGLRDGIWNLYWVSRATKETRQLTRQEKPNVYVRYPTWSPRGDEIVYETAETLGNVWMLSR